MSVRHALRIVCEALRPDGRDRYLSEADEPAWQAALALANHHFVTPALYAALAQSGRLGLLPPEVCDYLKLLYDANTARNGSIRRQALELLDALAAADIEVVLMKGGVSLFAPGEDQPGRMLRDLDLLVPKAALDKALGVLEELGYDVADYYPSGHNAFGELARQGSPAAVDVHVEPIDTPHLLPARHVQQRARPVTVDGTRFFIPSATDRVLHNVLHAQVHDLGNHYLGVIELRQLHEFAVLARSGDPDIDWAWIASHMTQHGLRAPLHAHAFAAHRLLGAPWPFAEKPVMRAPLHLQRCLLQLQMPLLAQLAIPIANLRAAFASHRMDGMYGRQASLVRRRLQHARRFLIKAGPGEWIARLWRSHAHPRGWRR